MYLMSEPLYHTFSVSTSRGKEPFAMRVPYACVFTTRVVVALRLSGGGQGRQRNLRPRGRRAHGYGARFAG